MASLEANTDRWTLTDTAIQRPNRVLEIFVRFHAMIRVAMTHAANEDNVHA